MKIEEEYEQFQTQNKIKKEERMTFSSIPHFLRLIYVFFVRVDAPCVILYPLNFLLWLFSLFLSLSLYLPLSLFLFHFLNPSVSFYLPFLSVSFSLSLSSSFSLPLSFDLFPSHL